MLASLPRAVRRFAVLTSAVLLVTVVLLAWPLERTSAALGLVNAITRNYDNTRAGANLNETILNTHNVSPTYFGALFSKAVDDEVYAGLLYASGVSIGGVNHDVVYVATVNNTIYAFDAYAGSYLWSSNFNNGFRPPNHTDVGQSCGTYNDFDGNIGIIGTPVIDGSALTMYVVTRTVETGSQPFVQRLRAIDITTGLERVPAVVIPTINPKTNNQRAALTLSQGNVYVPWSSHCDTTPYHGIIMAFNASNLSVANTFDAGATQGMAGIWMTGAGPVADTTGNLFFSTGNSNVAGSDYSQSLVKVNSALAGAIGFRPTDYDNSADDDFGSAGPIVVPGWSDVVTGGKNGDCFVVDMSSLSNPFTWQCVSTANGDHELHNSLVAWLSPSGLNLYSWGDNDFGRSWRFTTASNVSALSVTNFGARPGMPGGLLALSANGRTAGSGILWASLPSGDANQQTVLGVLRAFNAEDLTQELWDSNMGTNNSPGNFSKGSPPIVANGRVFLASLSHYITVYGLLPLAPALLDTVEAPLL